MHNASYRNQRDGGFHMATLPTAAILAAAQAKGRSGQRTTREETRALQIEQDRLQDLAILRWEASA